jgi:hypothetical protein
VGKCYWDSVKGTERGCGVFWVFVMDGRCGLRSEEEAELGDLADLLES